jgi:ERCC4-type nuclease
MNLIVDCREKSLSEYLGCLEVEHTTESLPLGDIVIKNSNEETVAIFERKSLNDLLSSISDGRYEEQSYRLSQCGLDKRKIYYIIEGNIENYVGKGEGLYSKSTIHSCIYSITYVKGFSLICSNSLTHTGDIIEKFYKKITSGSGSEISEHATYLDSIKLSKKSNLTDEMVSVMMLAQIPKVSKNAALTIMKLYNFNIPELVTAISNDEKCLETIMCDISNNKQRKLSKPCISNIKKYLLKV